MKSNPFPENICVVHRGEGKAYAWDDVPGGELDPILVLKAREAEMASLRERLSSGAAMLEEASGDFVCSICS